MREGVWLGASVSRVVFFFSVKASLRHTPKRTQRENTDTSDTHVHVHVGEETGRPEGQQASRRCARPTGAERADGLASEQRPHNKARQRAGAGGATRVARTRREGPGRAGTCCSGRAGRQHRRRGRQRGDRPIARWGRGSRRLANMRSYVQSAVTSPGRHGGGEAQSDGIHRCRALRWYDLRALGAGV